MPCAAGGKAVMTEEVGSSAVRTYVQFFVSNLTSRLCDYVLLKAPKLSLVLHEGASRHQF